MKTLVIGGGVLGLTSAYCLSERGHEVTVVERQAGPGLETSFANGALLTPSMSEPWIAPGSWQQLAMSIGRSNAPLQLRLRALPTLVGWSVQALKQSKPAAFARNALSNLKLAQYSLEMMRSIRDQTGIEYGRATLGTLRIFREARAFDRARSAAAQLALQGMHFNVLSPEESAHLEPALGPIKKELAGVIHYPGDETGDAYQFCVGLSDYLRRRGVLMQFQTKVISLDIHSAQVTAVQTQHERLIADQYVVAAGSYTAPLLRQAGIRTPVQPVKGYSITFDATHNPSPLRMPIVDDQLHAVLVPLAGALRVAGTAEFAGFDEQPNPARIHNLIQMLNQVLPKETFDPVAARAWCGLRALSSDGVPVIGPTSVPNLFVNTGHGHLGWTMAAGSARLLADLVCATRPSIDPRPYAYGRLESVSHRLRENTTGIVM